jgi:WD40 repeat protein
MRIDLRRVRLCSLLGLALAACAPGPGEYPSPSLTSMKPSVPARVFGKQDGDGNAITFSPDGQTIATVALATHGGTLWSLHDGSRRKLERGQWAIRFAPDGGAIATAGRMRDSDEAVELIDLRSGSVRALSARRHYVIALAYSPDGRLLASGSSDRTVRLWDLRTGAHKVLEHPRSTQALAFSPDGRVLAVGVRDGSISLWNLEAEVVAAPRIVRGHDRPVNSIAFSPDGTTLASGSSDGTVKLWNLANGRLRTLAVGDVVRNISYSRRGDKLAACAGATMVHTSGKIVLWDLSKGTYGVFAENLPGSAIIDAAFSPVDDTLAAIDGDGTVRVWRIE